MRTRGVLDGIAAERPEGRGEEMDRRADRARINYLSKEVSKAIAMGGCICAGWNREIHRGGRERERARGKVLGKSLKRKSRLAFYNPWCEV